MTRGGGPRSPPARVPPDSSPPPAPPPAVAASGRAPRPGFSGLPAAPAAVGLDQTRRKNAGTQAPEPPGGAPRSIRRHDGGSRVSSERPGSSAVLAGPPERSPRDRGLLSKKRFAVLKTPSSPRSLCCGGRGPTGLLRGRSCCAHLVSAQTSKAQLRRRPPARRPGRGRPGDASVPAAGGRRARARGSPASGPSEADAV